ncbi:dTDP-glucose 4,6-dehydratase [Sphaerobacter thermophilus]|uniref:dTDP-glucose 4,6-dehydratase n=1 Tax=Sphaerobacter thermophilus (strain ATCC 49802 / DSM 20745 / KCCM 41009 / NCIMB 13125 / S 6022) TaxID=479434 RepID=D1C2D7_SPHTD|nr:dTDP-glucose 4,6-dehydratase [Sphaerobacter thermophilus]ACZ38404.1 dTDP-glucose 4,6-dehydratase [Sphaerobacter thermophilus DSM 20745]
MRQDLRHVLVTGGAGFIGSNFVRYLLERGVPRVTVYDKLTYAGNRANLADIEDHPGFRFIHADICDRADVATAMRGCDAVVNFAAETHVDRSLLDADDFLRTNVVGTHVLLEAAREHGVRHFVHVSTDEVYGDVPVGESREEDPLRPRSPYSASKAGGEMMVLAAVATHGVPATITRGSNTYGPYQYPEKFIPLMITNALEGRPLPIYGDGLQVRDWIHVLDHCSGIETVLLKGKPGEAYNIGGGNPRQNLDVAREILDLLGQPHDLIQHVEDRLGHDRRYALATGKLRALGWRPQVPFEQGLRDTVEWYRERRDWWEPLRDAAFAEYYGRNYGSRAVIKAPDNR